MLSFWKPTVATIERFVHSEAALPFTYAAVGATRTKPPHGFNVDHTRVELGQGEACFRLAQEAIRRWEQFNLDWVQVWSPETLIQPGETVGVSICTFGIWWLNSARIVYVIDEPGPISQFGFAYGTLPGHAECGEERFMVEWDQTTNRVYYDILAFSQTRHLLTRLGYPVVRRFQKLFAQDSANAMRWATNQA